MFSCELLLIDPNTSSRFREWGTHQNSLGLPCLSTFVAPPHQRIPEQGLHCCCLLWLADQFKYFEWHRSNFSLAKRETRGKGKKKKKKKKKRPAYLRASQTEQVWVQQMQTQFWNPQYAADPSLEDGTQHLRMLLLNQPREICFYPKQTRKVQLPLLQNLRWEASPYI